MKGIYSIHTLKHTQHNARELFCRDIASRQHTKGEQPCCEIMKLNTHYAATQRRQKNQPNHQTTLNDQHRCDFFVYLFFVYFFVSIG